MSLFAQSKLRKALSFSAFILVLSLAFTQTEYAQQAKDIILAPPAVLNSTYVLPLNEQASEELIYNTLQAFERDEAALAKAAQASGLTYEQVSERLHTVYVLDGKALRVEFASDLSAEKLKGVYGHLLEELELYMKGGLR